MRVEENLLLLCILLINCLKTCSIIIVTFGYFNCLPKRVKFHPLSEKETEQMNQLSDGQVLNKAKEQLCFLHLNLHLWRFQVGLGFLNPGLHHPKPGPQTSRAAPALPESLLKIRISVPPPNLLNQNLHDFNNPFGDRPAQHRTRTVFGSPFYLM